MCQWFGFSSRENRDASPFFHELFKSKIAEKNPDGWGVAFYSGRKLVVLKEKTNASKSRLAKSISTGKKKISGNIVIGHVRDASEPKIISHGMTHPFSRNFWGRQWVFCHKGCVNSMKFEKGYFRPVSSNDSERMFCFIMNEIRSSCSSSSPRGKIASVVKRCAKRLEKGGESNFLLSDGDFLIANGHHYFRRAKIRNEKAIIFATMPFGMGLAWKKARGVLVARNGNLIK